MSLKAVVLFATASVALVIKRPKTREQRAEWLNGFCRRILRNMNITVRSEGSYPTHGMLISNHLGYLDILALGGLHRCVFVSKAELLDVPVVGWMTMMAGTVYVERGRGGSSARAREGMLGAAEAGIPVTFFPEGTTTNGSTVGPFHSGLLALALEAEQPVTAAFVSYRLTQDNGPGITVGDDVCYWGDDATMLPHVFRLVSLRGIEIHVRIADAPIQFSAAAKADRKEAANEAREAVMLLGGITEAEPVVQ